MSKDKMGELRDRVAALKTEVESLADLDEPTEADTLRLDEAVAEFAEARTQFEQAEARAAQVEEIRQVAITKPENVESVERLAKNDPVLGIRHNDPFDLSETRGMQGRALSHELRSRAHDAIEMAPGYVSDAFRSEAARKVDGDIKGGIAEHVLRYGSEEYAENFFEYFTTGRMEQRTAMSLSVGNGGYMLPTLLDPSVILTNAGTANPWRQISQVRSITQNVFHLVSSAGVSAEWIGEGSEVTDASPTFSGPTITAYKADAHAEASREAVEDIDNLPMLLTSLFQDARDRLEATAFATGSGSSQPQGIISKLGGTTASRVAANTNGSFGAIDVFNLSSNLPARYQDGRPLAWVAPRWVYNLTRQLGGPQTPNFWVDLGPGIPSQLLGVSTYISSDMGASGGTGVGLSSATASSDDILVLGDFSNYIIVDRIGTEILFDPVVLGSNRRPTGQVSWTAFWRVGADTPNVDAFRLLRV